MRMTYTDTETHVHDTEHNPQHNPVQHKEYRLGRTDHTDGHHRSHTFLHTVEHYFKEEMEDVLKYTEMCRKAKEVGDLALAAGLSEILMDEFTHAYFFRTRLECMGYDVSARNPELEDMWHNVLREINLH